jgi:mRNA interferase MazF
MDNPVRGEIWLVDLNPTRGREQGGRRPGLVVSVDLFNQGPAGLVIVIPITTKEKGIPLHVEIKAPEGGLTKRSFIKCEDIRSVSRERLVQRLGQVTRNTLDAMEDRLRILLNL